MGQTMRKERDDLKRSVERFKGLEREWAKEKQALETDARRANQRASVAEYKLQKAEASKPEKNPIADYLLPEEKEQVDAIIAKARERMRVAQANRERDAVTMMARHDPMANPPDRYGRKR